MKGCRQARVLGASPDVIFCLRLFVATRVVNDTPSERVIDSNEVSQPFCCVETSRVESWT